MSVTQTLVLIPAFYLIIGAAVTEGVNTNMAYAGGLMVMATVLMGGCTPAMILGWTRPDPDESDSKELA